MIIDRIFPTKPNIPTDGIRTPRKTLVNVEPLLLVIFDTSLEPKNPHVLSHWSFEFDVFTSLDIVVNAPMSDAKEEKIQMKPSAFLIRISSIYNLFS